MGSDPGGDAGRKCGAGKSKAQILFGPCDNKYILRNQYTWTGISAYVLESADRNPAF